MTDASLAEAVRAAGWASAELDLAGVRDKAAFLQRCAEALRLPDWFGHNWDALADSLTDSPVFSGADAGAGLLVVSGWQGYAKAAPQEWRIAQEVLADGAGRPGGPVTVVLALG